MAVIGWNNNNNEESCGLIFERPYITNPCPRICTKIACPKKFNQPITEYGMGLSSSKRLAIPKGIHAKNDE